MPEAPVELNVDGRAVRLTSPSKPYFPLLGLNKLEVAEYFLSVGPGILAALKDRPTTMERWPNGVSESSSLVSRENPDGDAFYNKRAPKGVPGWVATASVTFPSGRKAQQVCPADLASIVWMVNMGCIRFHPWPVRAPQTDLVDQLRLDLDPQPGTGFADTVVAATELRGVLSDAGLTGFVKTSGGRGVHVFVPVVPVNFIEARHAAIALGRELARRLPDRVTVNWWKEERGSRIFVDFNQMARDRLMTSAYSIRPTPEGRVSAPLTWEELPDVNPDDFTLVTMPARFAEAGDVWAPLYAADAAPVDGALEWYARDDADGTAEMPYPPEYPKMPGEPPRVQPSKKNAANWD